MSFGVLSPGMSFGVLSPGMSFGVLSPGMSFGVLSPGMSFGVLSSAKICLLVLALPVAFASSALLTVQEVNTKVLAMKTASKRHLRSNSRIANTFLPKVSLPRF
jgi:hypothetical protein